MELAERLPEIGQLAEVRGRRFVATAVQRSAEDTSATFQHLVSLTSVEDGSLGEELQVIWESEIGARAFERNQLPQPTTFDDPSTLDAFLDAVRWGIVSNADVRSFHAPFRSGVEIEDYQLDPLVRAVQMPRVNLLVADGVGLGKTIESGLIIQELIFRNRIRTVLIVCPSSLQIQWREEMREKFGLEFKIVDSDLLRDLRRTRGVHANPWSHFPRLITSYDYLKRDRNLRLFQDLVEGKPSYPRTLDLLVCDEVHNVAPSGRNAATASIRTEAIKTIAPHFEHRLFLSATPHNGYKESFAALLELLDNQRYQRGADINAKQLHGVTMIRRLRSDISSRWDGTRRFPTRHIEPLRVPYTPEEREVHALLKEYSELRRKNSSGENQLYAVEFLLKLLKKRLFSSPSAFLHTLEAHRKSFNKKAATTKVTTKSSKGILQRMAEELEGERTDDQAYHDSFNEAVEAATSQTGALSDREKELLKQMAAWAEHATAAGDSKGAELLKWLHQHIKPAGKWSDERVIIFTEYRDTQNWLHSLLAGAGLAETGRVMRLFGGMDPYDREASDPDGPMCGIFLGTASSDSEGTLGGLVALGRADELGAIMDVALERLTVCASDPMCATYVPESRSKLHGAACHSCGFLPETSCERANRYLDRALLVETMTPRGTGFFKDA